MFQHNLFSVQWTGSWKAHCCHHFESVRFRLCMTFAFQVDWSQDQDSSWAFPRQITFASIWVKSNRISVFECSNFNISLMGDVHFTNSFWVSAWFFSCQIVRVHYKAEEKSLQHTYTVRLLRQAMINRLRRAPLPHVRGQYRTLRAVPEAGVQLWWAQGKARESAVRAGSQCLRHCWDLGSGRDQLHLKIARLLSRGHPERPAETSVAERLVRTEDSGAHL